MTDVVATTAQRKGLGCRAAVAGVLVRQRHQLISQLYPCADIDLDLSRDYSDAAFVNTNMSSRAPVV
jgi:hypothetical protein